MATTTDPTMLSSWYDSYSKSAPPGAGGPTAAVAAPITPTVAPTAPVTNAAASTWTPGANATVQGQLKNVLDAGGPLQDRAQTKALQTANSRGLLNSTMAVTAGQSALYDAALPIAQQDANTFADAGKTNSGQSTQVSLANAGASNSAAQQHAGLTQQSTLQATDLNAQAASQGRDLASRYDLSSLDVNSRAALQAADAANQQKLQAANAVLQTGLQATDLGVRQSMQAYNLAVQQSMQGLDNQSRLGIATLNSETQTHIAGIEAKYRTQIQSNASMAASYQSMVDGYTRIMLDPNMDAAAKTTAIGNLTTLYNNTLKMQADVTGLQLGKLLNPDGKGARTGAADPAADPGQAPGLEPVPAPATAPVVSNPTDWSNFGGA